MSSLQYLSDPTVERLLKSGFDAFHAGKEEDASPFKPSFENAWWRKGWECAALAAHLSAKER